MTVPAPQRYLALTEKEKQTLRLIVRGYDAKSIATRLGLSVHTINERLRDARRKMAVSSSREAARLLLDIETPHSSVDMTIGEAADSAIGEPMVTPIPGDGHAQRRPWTMIGVALMTLALGMLALTALPQLTATSTPAVSSADEAADPAVMAAALQFLELGDRRQWNDGYRMTGTAFRKLNTSQVWARTSEKVRTPLGAVLSREPIGQTFTPAPPYGYQVVRFRTSFANKAHAVETVTLDLENGEWRVVGVTVG